jgi:hypothetical protein
MKAGNWRDNFLDSMVKSRAKDKGTSPESEEKSLKQIKQQRRQARNVK